VISLINGKAIQPGCYGGTEDGSAHQREQEKDEEAQADSRRLSMLDWHWRDRSAQTSSGPLNEAKRSWNGSAL
jgi:hypothetical protein